MIVFDCCADTRYQISLGAEGEAHGLKIKSEFVRSSCNKFVFSSEKSEPQHRKIKPRANNSITVMPQENM